MRIDIRYTSSRSSPHRVVAIDDKEEEVTIALASSKAGVEAISCFLNADYNRPIAQLLMIIGKANVDPHRYEPLRDFLALQKDGNK